MAQRFSRRTWVLLSLIPLLVLVYWAAWFALPLQMSELSNRWELWREGVSEVESAGLKGYLRDTCKTALSGKDCTCVALVHGLADSSMTWKRILLWPENGWLSPIKLYAFDLPGSGRSQAPTDASDYRVRRQAGRLKETLAPLCKNWIVAGNSLGGWIAAWLALDWPEGVGKVILLDSAGLKASVSEGEAKSYFEEPTVESLKEFQRRAYFKPRPLPENVWGAVVRRMRESNARPVMLAQTPEDYLEGRLGTLRRPTLVLWGASDRVTPPSTGQQIKAMIPGSIWHEVPECGHLPQKECPLEVIKAIQNMINYGGV